MAITSNDVDTQSFSVDRKGYSIQEVDDFLEKVSKEVGLLNANVDKLKKDKEGAFNEAKDETKEEMEELNKQLTQQKIKIDQLEAELSKKVDDGKAISEALIVAQRSADKMIGEANDKAKKIIKDANDKADYIEKDADQQKKKVMSEIDNLEKKRASVQKEYQSMLRDIISALEKYANDANPNDSKKDNNANAASRPAPASETAKNPAVNGNAAKQPAPVNPEQSKDFSGFGDADFGGDKID